MRSNAKTTTALVCALAAGAVAVPAAQGAVTVGDRAAYGKQCQSQSKKRVVGTTRTPFSTCVAAMAALARGESRSAQLACGKLSHRRGGGPTSPFASCVAAGRRLIRNGNGIDLSYVEQMIEHHAAAVEMAQLALARAQHPVLQTLVQNIVVSQNAEIARMRPLAAGIRAAGIRPVSLRLTAAQMGMSHDLSRLIAAQPFDVVFIDMMVAHHRGAITMSQVVSARGAGAGVRSLAEQITRAQTSEIQVMRDVRVELTGSPEPVAAPVESSAGH